MSQQCQRCPALQGEIGQLRGQVRQLERIAAELRQRLGWLHGAVTSTVRFIDQQQQKPTMPRSRILPTVRERLAEVADTVERQ